MIRIDMIGKVENIGEFSKVEVGGYNCVTNSGWAHPEDLCVLVTPLTKISNNVIEEFGPLTAEIITRPGYMGGMLSEAQIYPIDLLNKFGSPLSRTYRSNYPDLINRAQKKDQSLIGYTMGNARHTSYFCNVTTKSLPKDLKLYKNPGGCVNVEPLRVYPMDTHKLKNLTGNPYYIYPKLDGIYVTFSTYSGSVMASTGGYKFKVNSEQHKFMVNSGMGDKIKNKYIVSGWMMGPGIYNNPAGLKELMFFVDDVKDSPHKWRSFAFPECGEIAKSLGLRFVPIDKFGNSFDLTMGDLIELANGTYPNKHPKKGIIVKNFGNTASGSLDNYKYMMTEVFE
jgi:hypothetical protein